jgi:transcriptional regulator with XRE-family HTH domain
MLACKVKNIYRESARQAPKYTFFVRPDMTSDAANPSTLGGRIGQARRRKGLALGRDVLVPEMAEAVGVTAATAYHWEADTKVPREEALGRLAGYLGVSPAWLRYGVQPERMVAPDPALDRRVTDAELENAREIVEGQPKRKPDGAHHPRRRSGGA